MRGPRKSEKCCDSMKLGRPVQWQRHSKSGRAEVARLGSHKRPAVVRVQSTEKAEEIVGFAQERGWKVIVGVEPDQIEISPISQAHAHRGQAGSQTAPAKD